VTYVIRFVSASLVEPYYSQFQEMTLNQVIAPEKLKNHRGDKLDFRVKNSNMQIIPYSKELVVIV